MRNTFLTPDVEETAGTSRMVDFLFTALCLGVLICMLFFFFDKGAEAVAETVVNVAPPEPW